MCQLTATERELLTELAESNGETVSATLRRLLRDAARDQLGWSPPVAKKKKKRKAAKRKA